jgi:hypothetical protein
LGRKYKYVVWNRIYGMMDFVGLVERSLRLPRMLF